MVACLTSQQHAGVSQGRICSDNFTCCHTEIKVADPIFYLIQSQYADTGPTSPSADPISPGAWQGSHWSANFLSHWYDSTPTKSQRKRDSNPGSSALEADALPLGQRGSIWVTILRMCPVFVVVVVCLFVWDFFFFLTFRLCGWCMLGVFLLLAFTLLTHGCQDLLSPCDGMHACTD